MPVRDRANEANRDLRAVGRLEWDAFVVIVLDDPPRGLKVVANREANPQRILQAFARFIVALKRSSIPAAQRMPVAFEIAKCVGDVAEHNLDRDSAGWRALVEIGVVERQVPLRIEDTAHGFENRGLRGIATADQTKNAPVRYRPVQFTDAPEISDRQMSYPHNPFGRPLYNGTLVSCRLSTCFHHQLCYPVPQLNQSANEGFFAIMQRRDADVKLLSTWSRPHPKAPEQFK